ncbi:TetR family transcriptional regulator [Propionicicella superfundia]|uniref:TetR family transcriptional regulator n=1 Tax=Propionicicella superfundia TaxID=348582 RepID=UPI000425409D
MTREQRRDQLVEVARGLFAEKGFEGTSVEEIAARAEVSKPVVYEHFGGKEGLYAVVVDREVVRLDLAIHNALTRQQSSARRLIELGTLALLDYIDESPEGFRIISRDTSGGEAGSGSFATILSGVATRVEHLLADHFERSHFPSAMAPMYAQMLVGLVGLTGQWWLDSRDRYDLSRQEVAAHLVNLAWNGMRHLEVEPHLRSTVPAEPVEGVGRAPEPS